MSYRWAGGLGSRRTLLGILVLGLVAVQAMGIANIASATTTTTHTKVRVTTTATVTETTTATGTVLGSRGVFVLFLLLAVAASIAVIGGYVWGRRRTRKNLLGVAS